MSQTIRILPDEFTKEQHHRVGITVPMEEGGGVWTYCMFPGGSSGMTYPAGAVLRDSVAADLLSGSNAGRTGTVTEVAAVGTNLLKDTGEFASKKYLRGAIGQIVASDGEGQKFQVINVPDDDTLEIALISNSASGNKPGWETALAATSEYRLWFPGLVHLSAATGSIIRGVLQAECVVPANEHRYGWAGQRGDLDFKIDASGTAIGSPGTPLRSAGSGLVQGGNAGSEVGIVTLGDLTGTVDVTTPGIGAIVNDAVSYRFPIKDKPYSRDDNGDLIL